MPSVLGRQGILEASRLQYSKSRDTERCKAKIALWPSPPSSLMILNHIEHNSLQLLSLPIVSRRHFWRIAMKPIPSSALPLLRTCRHTSQAIHEVTKRGFVSARQLRQRTNIPYFGTAFTNLFLQVQFLLSCKAPHQSSMMSFLASGRRFSCQATSM